MKIAPRRLLLPMPVYAGLILLLQAACVQTPGPGPSLSTTGMQPGFEAPEEQPRIRYDSYSGLSELVTLICDDAIAHFDGFYAHSVVRVEPFVSLDEFQRGKVSQLGIALADQMVAMVNNETAAGIRQLGGRQPDNPSQKLSGVLQEMDGYLRIHISGRNAYGERLSYVANIEMSEAIYRALHTYL